MNTCFVVVSRPSLAYTIYQDRLTLPCQSISKNSMLPRTASVRVFGPNPWQRIVVRVNSRFMLSSVVLNVFHSSKPHKHVGIPFVFHYPAPQIGYSSPLLAPRFIKLCTVSLTFLHTLLVLSLPLKSSDNSMSTCFQLSLSCTLTLTRNIMNRDILFKGFF